MYLKLKFLDLILVDSDLVTHSVVFLAVRSVSWLAYLDVCRLTRESGVQITKGGRKSGMAGEGEPDFPNAT